MKLTSDFAILDIKDGRDELVKHLGTGPQHVKHAIALLLKR